MHHQDILATIYTHLSKYYFSMQRLAMDAFSPHQVAIASFLGLVVLLTILVRTKRRAHDHESKQIPEASGARPIIGHLHLLATGVPTYQVLGDMADKHGPIFTIRLGARRVIVVSSWEWAKEFYTTHDRNFLDRPNTNSAASKYLCYNGALFGFTNYGPYWRNMRRISTQEILSNARIEQLRPVRSSELNTCIRHLFSLCERGPAKVDMSEWFTYLTINVMLQMIVGKRYDIYDNDEHSRRFQRGIGEFLELVVKFVMSDVVPFTEWIDFQGHIKRMKHVAKELDYFLSTWLEEHVRKRQEGKVKDNEQDFMDVMLETIDQSDTSSLGHHPIENVIKGTSLNLILGGTETTSYLLTWALTLTLNHGEVLRKAQNEIDVCVGKERWVEESDIKDMPYIVAIIKETLRAYPTSPTTLLHEATEDCLLVGKYRIPKGTFMLLNIWKLHRDSRVWPDPAKFDPERFLTTHAKFNLTGQNFEYLPFSSGRRSCPGVFSAMQMICLALARVLQGFNFATPNGQSIDMSIGRMGLSLSKAIPLEVILTPRLSSHLYEETK